MDNSSDEEADMVYRKLYIIPSLSLPQLLIIFTQLLSRSICSSLSTKSACIQTTSWYIRAQNDSYARQPFWSIYRSCNCK